MGGELSESRFVHKACHISQHELPPMSATLRGQPVYERCNKKETRVECSANRVQGDTQPTQAVGVN